MRVLDHAPHAWFLLEHDGALFLDAACNNSAFGYSWLIELDAHERDGFQRGGRAFLDRLAQDIHNGVPILAASRSPYKARDRSARCGDLVSHAIATWRLAASTGA